MEYNDQYEYNILKKCYGYKNIGRLLLQKRLDMVGCFVLVYIHTTVSELEKRIWIIFLLALLL
jgi:hypothetical protein